MDMNNTVLSLMDMNNTSEDPIITLVKPDKNPAYHPSKILIVFHVLVLVVICISAIVGNNLVINVVLRDYRLHKPTFYFVVNLAVADILTAVVYIPFYAIAVVKQEWLFEEPFCMAHTFLISLGINASLVTLSFVSVDRFLDITFPLLYLTKMTPKRMRMMLAFGWVHSVFWAAGPLVGWGEYIFDHQTNTCRPNWATVGAVNKSYVVLLGIFGFVLPLLIMIFCYAKIFMVVEKHVKEIEKVASAAASMESLDKQDSPVHSQEHRRTRDLRAHKMILVIILVFLGCWIPYSIVVAKKVLLEETSGSYWSVNGGLTLALLTTAVNPLIYAMRDRRFKRGFMKFFCGLRHAYGHANNV